jgi:hypothetical protein
MTNLLDMGSRVILKLMQIIVDNYFAYKMDAKEMYYLSYSINVEFIPPTFLKMCGICQETYNLKNNWFFIENIRNKIIKTITAAFIEKMKFEGLTKEDKETINKPVEISTCEVKGQKTIHFRVQRKRFRKYKWHLNGKMKNFIVEIDLI